ncbi:hypothetical protein JW859_05650 [bacterium]|nr:hypothetical protein [bacterium]
MDTGDGENHTAGTYDPGPYLAAVDWLEEDAQRRRKSFIGWQVAIFVLMLIATIICDLYGLVGGLAYGIAIGLNAILLLAGSQYGNTDETTVAQLNSSGLAGRIVRGELRHDPAYDHMPSLLRRFYQQADYSDPGRLMRHLARELRFYLTPPRRYIPSSFYFASILLIVLCMLLVFAIPTMYEELNPLRAGFIVTFLGLELSMINFGAFGLFEYTPVLTGYLREQWQSHAGTVPVTETGDPTTRIMLILNQVENDARIAFGQLLAPYFFVSVMALIAPVALLGMYLQQLLNADESSFMWLYLIGLIVLANYLIGAYLRAMQARIKRKLDGSDIAMRIAIGDLNYAEIEEYVPWLFKGLLRFPLMPRGYADDLRKMIWRLSFHLDWYLKPPATYIRLSWVALMAAAVLVVVCAVLVLMTWSSLGLTVGLWLLLGGLIVILALIGYDATLYWYTPQLLVAKVREQLAADEGDGE